MKQLENKTQAAGAGVATAEMPELLTLQQASKILKVHPNTLRNWERAGVIPVVRVGPRRDRRFPKHGIHQFFPPAQSMSAAPAASAQAQPAQETETVSVDGTTDQSEEVLSTPNVTEEELEAVQDETPADPSAAETPHVIVNVPPKTSMRTVVTVAVLALALGVAALLFGPDLLRMSEQTGQPTFAIRRNPPKTIFSEDFEVYEPGELPRPTWNTIGLWEVVKKDGQRVLKGEEAVDNPLGALSHTYTGSSEWKDYRVKFNARITSGAQAVTALVNYLDENNYYAVTYTQDAVAVNVVQEGRERELGKAPISYTKPADWHTFTIDLLGNDLDILFNGERVLGITDAGLTSGKVGFAVADQVVEFDHLQVVESDGVYRPND